MLKPLRRRLVGLLGVAAVSWVPVVGPAQASAAVDQAVPVITSASLKLNYHYLSPTMGIAHGYTGALTLHIDWPSTPDPGASEFTHVTGTFGADDSSSSCYETIYDGFDEFGSMTTDGSHVTVVRPVVPCGPWDIGGDVPPDHPGGFTLGHYGAATSSVLHISSDIDTWHNADMVAPANIRHFHLWSFTRISESTSLITIKGVRYRNLAGVLQKWDAPNQSWRRFAGAKVRLYFTPPGGTRKWVATKYTASDGSYHFRTSNTKPGTWRVYFQTSEHYWTSSRSLSVH